MTASSSLNTDLHRTSPQLSSEIGLRHKQRFKVERSVLMNLVLGGTAICFLFLRFWIGGAASLGFFSFGLMFCVLNLRATATACVKNWPLLLVPSWGAVTLLWSHHPMATFSYVVQMALSLVFCLSILRVLPLKFIVAVLCGCLTLVVSTVLLSSETVVIYQTGEVVRIGVLGSKNNVSIVATSALVLGAMMLGMSKNEMIYKLLATVAILVALATMIQAKSLGTLVAATGCASLVYAMRSLSGLFQSVAKRIVLIWGIFILAILGLVSFVTSVSYQDYVTFMYSIGKDPSLTGRTFLWAIGFNNIEENFWGGVGLNAFWVVSNPDAILMWMHGSRKIGAFYGFHNTYIHHWVETGIVGAMIYASLIATLVFRIIQRTQERMLGYEAPAAAFALFLLSKSFLETINLTPVSSNSFIFFLTWVILNRTHPDLKSR